MSKINPISDKPHTITLTSGGKNKTTRFVLK